MFFRRSLQFREGSEGQAEGQNGEWPSLKRSPGLLAVLAILAMACLVLVAGGATRGGASPGRILEETELPMTSKFVTNSKWMKWRFKKDASHSLFDAFKDAFPDEKGWWGTVFASSDQPKKTWWWQDVVYWAQDELLKKTNATFPEDMVPIPIAEHSDDQLNPGEWVGYTRRQVCYLAAKALTGATLDGYDNGLTRYLSKKGPGGCSPRKGMFAKALFALLTTCAADPTLKDGAPGPMIIVVKHRPSGTLEQLKNWSSTLPMSESGFRLCRYEEGSEYKQGFLPGVPNSPKELCAQPSNGPGVDYLSTPALKQALVDSSGPWVGGNFYGGACDAKDVKLEEALMLLMPEVAVLSLFLSQAEHPQLRAPAWVLGARMVLTGIDGTRHWTNWRTNPDFQFQSDLVPVDLQGEQLMVSRRKPFVAAVPAFKASFGNLKEARQNRALAQRQAHGPNAFKQQVLAWYQALSLYSLPPEFRDQMPKLVGSIGTGPWASGARFGDSQMDVLAIWLGQTLASKSWTLSGPSVFLDFYLYSTFTENPGNQCYLHSSKRCGACLWTCKSKWFPPGSFYLPDKGFMSGDKSKPCVMWSEFACSQHGIEDMFWNFAFKPANRLWTMVEKVLEQHKDQNQRSVFDRLNDELSYEVQAKLDPWQM